MHTLQRTHCCTNPADVRELSPAERDAVAGGNLPVILIDPRWIPRPPPLPWLTRMGNPEPHPWRGG